MKFNLNKLFLSLINLIIAISYWSGIIFKQKNTKFGTKFGLIGQKGKPTLSNFVLSWPIIQKPWKSYYKVNNYGRQQIILNSNSNYTKYRPRTHLLQFKTCAGLNDIVKHLKIIPNENDLVFLFKNCGCHALHSKMEVWKNLINYYGINQNIMPESYRLDQYNDFQRFKSKYNNQKHKFLVKLDIDKRKGLYLYHSLSNAEINSLSRSPSLIQKIQPDPYLVNDFRTTFRFYFVIYYTFNQPQKPNIYLYHDGLLHVSHNPYNPHSNDLSTLLASYPDYMSPENYQKYKIPRTYQKLRDLLKFNNTPMPVSNQGLVMFFHDLLKPFLTQINKCEIDSNLSGNISRVHLFGADIGYHRNPTNRKNFKPYLYELNSGPQLLYDNLDDWQILINNMLQDMMCLINILPTTKRQKNQETQKKWLPIF